MREDAIIIGEGIRGFGAEAFLFHCSARNERPLAQWLTGLALISHRRAHSAAKPPHGGFAALCSLR